MFSRQIALAFTIGLAGCIQPDVKAAQVQPANDAAPFIADYSGVSAVVRDGEVLHLDASGFANKETGEAITPGTRFNLASIGKLFTQIAVLQLVEAGRLDMDAQVGTYLPEYPNEDVRDRVTIGQLYEMRSGMGDIFTEAYTAETSKQLDTLSDYLTLFVDAPLAFEPGTDRAYSNAGYILLGLIIEEVSDLSFPAYVQHHIAEPAGMTATGFDRYDELVHGIAIGYRSDAPMMRREPGAPPPAPDGPLRPNTDDLPARGSSGGGSYSSVLDFIALDRALRDGVLLPQSRLVDFFGEEFDSGASPAVFGGGFPGVSTVVMFFPDGTTVLAFSNRNRPSSMDVAQALAEEFAAP